MSGFKLLSKTQRSEKLPLLEPSKKKINFNGELEGLRKNGEVFPFQISVRELAATPYSPPRLIVTAHDLTTEKKQEEQLRRSQKMDALGKLTGGVAHDFNNLLGIIQGYSEILKTSLGENAKLANYADEIHRASERGARLTGKLLSFSREQAAQLREVDINEVLREQKQVLTRSLTARYEISYDLIPSIWPVLLDDNDLEDAIINLSINAMHAMPNGGRLTFKTANIGLEPEPARKLAISPGDYVKISILDTGTGMDDEVKTHLFDPFFSTKGDKGVGLGLSQVYGFMQRSKGAIEVHSQPGHGSKFSLYFPRVCQDRRTEDSRLGKLAETPRGNGETVLIVDDEVALRTVTAEILSNYDYRVLTAKNSEQALKILDIEKIDLLLSDVIMAGMDGYQLAEAVQEKHPGVKIQLLSGFDHDRFQDRMETQLQKNLLNKPVPTYILLQRLADIFATNTKHQSSGKDKSENKNKLCRTTQMKS